MFYFQSDPSVIDLYSYLQIDKIEFVGGLNKYKRGRLDKLLTDSIQVYNAVKRYNREYCSDTVIEGRLKYGEDTLDIEIYLGWKNDRGAIGCAYLKDDDVVKSEIEKRGHVSLNSMNRKNRTIKTIFYGKL